MSHSGFGLNHFGSFEDVFIHPKDTSASLEQCTLPLARDGENRPATLCQSLNRTMMTPLPCGP